MARYWQIDVIGATVFTFFALISGSLNTRVLSAGFPTNGWVLFATVLISAAGVFLVRSLPGAGLALLWLSTVVQALTQTDAFAVQLAALYVIFAATRFGSRLVLWLAGASVFLLAGLGAFYFFWIGSWTRTYTWVGLQPTFGLPRVFGLAFLVVLALAIPWFLGLIVRYATLGRVALRGQISAEQDAASAREFARLRERHTELARDVHDIVGHSLAVIIAQADSVRFIPDSDPDRIRLAVANISGSARTSLAEVRTVLASTQGHDEQGRALTSPEAASLDALIEASGAAGNPVANVTHGRPRALSPKLEMVTFRVLQELLTNAIRHGVENAPIQVVRQWDDEGLRLSVRNEFAPPPENERVGGGGSGIAGARARLADVGGGLQSKIEVDASGTVFYSSVALLPIDNPRHINV